MKIPYNWLKDYAEINVDAYELADRLTLSGSQAEEVIMQGDTIKNVVAKDTPFLGICLGLQLLFKESEETPGAEGLNLLPGKIFKIPAKEGFKIPHMGWNSLNVKDDARLFAGINANPYVYFVHSYYLKADNDDIVAASTEYSTHIHASVEKGNLFACQFHPEKSSETGLRILKNFAEL